MLPILRTIKPSPYSQHQSSTNIIKSTHPIFRAQIGALLLENFYFHRLINHCKKVRFVQELLEMLQDGHLQLQ